jgi:hypothetical protein
MDAFNQCHASINRRREEMGENPVPAHSGGGRKDRSTRARSNSFSVELLNMPGPQKKRSVTSHGHTALICALV